MQYCGISYECKLSRSVPCSGGSSGEARGVPPLILGEKRRIYWSKKSRQDKQNKIPLLPPILRSGSATVVLHCTRAPSLFVATSEVKVSRQTPLGCCGLAIIKRQFSRDLPWRYLTKKGYNAATMQVTETRANNRQTNKQWSTMTETDLSTDWQRQTKNKEIDSNRQATKLTNQNLSDQLTDEPTERITGHLWDEQTARLTTRSARLTTITEKSRLKQGQTNSLTDQDIGNYQTLRPSHRQTVRPLHWQLSVQQTKRQKTDRQADSLQTKKRNKSPYWSVEVFSTTVLMEYTEISKQILQIKQKLVKNPNWGRLFSFSAIYKTYRSWIRDHQTQIHSVAGSRIWARDLRITNPAP